MDVTGNVIRGNEKQKQSKTMLSVRWPFSLGIWLFPPEAHPGTPATGHGDSDPQSSTMITISI